MSVTRHEVIVWAEDCARTIRIHGADVTACGRGDLEKLDFIARALRDPEPDPPRRHLTDELLDLIALMPDSQVDEILAFVHELRAIRARHAAANALGGPSTTDALR